MFQLVGAEIFYIGKTKCVIKIEPVGGFAYEYCLEINGKSYKKFIENQSKIMKCWGLHLNGVDYRVALGITMQSSFQPNYLSVASHRTNFFSFIFRKR